MRRYIFPILLAAEASICIIFSLFGSFFSGFFTTLIAFPMEQIAWLLRRLSLSGIAGNILAIILYITLSLTPMLFLLRKKNHWEDLFLLLLSAQLFLCLYTMINPGLIDRSMILPLGEQAEKTMMGSMFYSLLVSYLVLRMIRSFFAADHLRLVHYLQILLGGLCVVLTYLVFHDGLTGLIQSIDNLVAGNNGNEHLLGTSKVFLTARFLVNALPYLLDILIAFAARALLHTEQNTDAAVCAVNRLSRLCGLSLIITTVSAAVYHILQLLFLKQIYQSSVTVELPLFSMLFMLVCLLAAQYIRENKELKQDQDLFI